MVLALAQLCMMHGAWLRYRSSCHDCTPATDSRGVIGGPSPDFFAGVGSNLIRYETRSAGAELKGHAVGTWPALDPKWAGVIMTCDSVLSVRAQ